MEFKSQQTPYEDPPESDKYWRFRTLEEVKDESRSLESQLKLQDLFKKSMAPPVTNRADRRAAKKRSNRDR